MHKLALAPLSSQAVHGEISFQSEQFLCDHDGALFWPDQNCLIVSDLHLEKSAAMAATGQLVPPYDTSDTLARLQTCIARWNPKTIISLGDSFHRANSAENLSATHQNQIRTLTQNHEWVWITGNHDPDAPSHLGGQGAFEVRLNSIIFRHEQNSPASAKSGLGEISGHLHPAAKLSRRGKSIRRRCFVSDGERLIMPAFGAYTGGLDLGHRAFAGILNKQQLQIWMLGHERVYKVCPSNCITK